MPPSIWKACSVMIIPIWHSFQSSNIHQTPPAVCVHASSFLRNVKYPKTVVFRIRFSRCSLSLSSQDQLRVSSIHPLEKKIGSSNCKNTNMRFSHQYVLTIFCQGFQLFQQNTLFSATSPNRNGIISTPNEKTEATPCKAGALSKICRSSANSLKSNKVGPYQL